MSRKRNIATIDIGTNTIKVVVFEVDFGKGGASEPRYIAHSEVQSAGIRNGYIINKYDTKITLKRAIEKAENSMGIKIKDVFVTLGGVALSSKRVWGQIAMEPETDDGFGIITQEDIEDAIDRARQRLLMSIRNIKILSEHPIFYTYDDEDILSQPVGVAAKSLGVSVLFVYYKENHFKDIEDIIEDNGLNLVDYIPSPLAIGKIALTPRQKMRGVILLDIGAETVTVAMFKNGDMIGLNVLDIGSYSITNDLSIQLKISLDEAEDLKINPDAGTGIMRSKITSIINTRLDSLLKVINKAITRVDKRKDFPAGIVVTGGGSLQEGIIDIIKNSLGLPAEIATITTKSADANKMKSPYWHAVYGAGFHASEYLSGGDGGIFDMINLSFLKKIFKNFIP